MNNPLLRSVVVVVITWWLILALMDGAGLSSFVAPWKASVVLAIASAGLGIVYLTMYIGRKVAAVNLAGVESRGLSVSIGGVPSGLGEPPRISGASLIPSDSRLYGWLQHATSAHPIHAALLQACIEVYASHRTLPASPVPGGHGGLRLIDHALHVAEVTLELAETWVYDGERDKKGRLRVPLIDPDYEFDRHDPLIPVLAFAHDIGKIECYATNEDGVLIEYRHDHDMVSGLVLARMKESWNLPAKDRIALFYAVSHYHHPIDLPGHADDRTRAIMELLIASDVEASTREGDPDRARAWKTLADEPTEDDVLWEAFSDLLASPSAINGADKENRVGYKFGNFVYLSEERVRFALAEVMNTPAAAEQRSRMGDGRFKISERLMKAMQERGILYCTHEGREYGVSRALFRVVFMDPRNPDFTVEMPAVIIMQPGQVFPHLLTRTDSRLAPTTVTPLFSENSAKHKKPQTDPRPATSDAVAQQPEKPEDASRTERLDVRNGSTSKPADPLELLNRLREEQEAAAKTRLPKKKKNIVVPVDSERDHILLTARKIIGSDTGWRIRYHVDDNKKATYLQITDEITHMIGEAGMAWLRGSEDKRLRIRAGEAAEYLVIGNEFIHKEANP